MTPAPLLLVRADADTEIGAGHVMRTLAVAQAWRHAGGRASYATCRMPEGLRARLEKEGCGLERWEDIEPGSREDGARLRDAAARTGAAALLVDGYLFGEAFRREVSRGDGPRHPPSRTPPPVRALVHDYGVDEPLWLDFVLNQNPHARAALYPRVERSRQLLGLRWAMLRREFVDSPRPARPAPSPPDPTRVLVTLGGGDLHDVTGRVLRALDEVDAPLDVRAVVGAANPRLDALRALAARSRHRLRVLHDVTDMPRLMAWADLAVAAAGSTSWELAWMGVPWLSVAIADNQRPILEELRRRQMAVALGWHEDVDEARIARAVSALIADAGARRGGSERATRAVDGRGAARVAALLRGQG